MQIDMVELVMYWETHDLSSKSGHFWELTGTLLIMTIEQYSYCFEQTRIYGHLKFVVSKGRSVENI